MAKYLRWLFAAVLVLGLAGCGKNPDNEVSNARIRAVIDGSKTPEELLAEWGASAQCSAQGNVVDPDLATNVELGGFIASPACRIGPHDENGARSGDPFSGPDWNPNAAPTCVVSQATVSHHSGETIAFRIFLSTLERPIVLLPTSPETGGSVGEFVMGVLGDEAVIFLRLTSPLPTTAAFSITAGVNAVGLAQPVTCSVHVLAEEPPASPTPDESPTPLESPTPDESPTPIDSPTPIPPTATFTSVPTHTFTRVPTATFTTVPTSTFTTVPTATFTTVPTSTFTTAPTSTFTGAPTRTFTTAPTATFTQRPTQTSTPRPTVRPTEPPCLPTTAPTLTPTRRPTVRPTQTPCHPHALPTPRPPCTDRRPNHSPCNNPRHRY